MNNWQKYTVIIIPAIIVLFVLFWAWQQEILPLPRGGMVACTEEAKQCPDGSYVGRMGPKCEFAKCPGEGGMERHSMDTSDWKTYQNEKYGYSIRYPESFTIFTDKNNKTETVTAPASNSTGVFLTDNKAHLFCCEPSLIRVEVFDTIITDLEKFAQEKGNLQTDNAYRVIKKGYEAFQGERAYRIYSSMGIDSPGNSIVFVHGNKTFFIQYNTDQSPFDDIIQSFQFIDTMQESWKTYRNEKYGFEFKYPITHGIRDHSLSYEGARPPIFLALSFCKKEIEFDCDGFQIIVYTKGTNKPSSNSKTFSSQTLTYEFNGFGYEEAISTFKFIKVETKDERTLCETNADCILLLCSGAVNKEWVKNAPPEPPCARYEFYTAQCIEQKCVSIKP